MLIFITIIPGGGQESRATLWRSKCVATAMCGAGQDEVTSTGPFTEAGLLRCALGELGLT